MATKKKTTSNKEMPKKLPIKPLGDRVVIRPLSMDEMGTTTASGIIIPNSAQEKPEQGTVVSVGGGKYDDGKLVPMEVSVDDRVLFSKYGYESVKLDGVEYYVISESNILAIIK